MLAFHPRFIRTFDDLPGHVSVLIHSWNGCNMRCFGCHNYGELIAKKPENYLTPAQVVARLADCGDLFDAVMFSGGEFLINDVSDVEALLQRVREVFKGIIVVYTNGTYPRKLRRLLEHGLVDGVHIDMKLPYHSLDLEEDREIFETILGAVPTPRYCRDMLESIEAVIKHNSKVSQVRTVRYPLLSDEYFEQIRDYVNDLNAKYDSEVPYFLNPFHAPQSAQ